MLRSLPCQLLVELASNVAEGIMQFYSTPWLIPADLGQNIRYFHPAGSETTGIQLQGPYFMVRLDSTRAKAKIHPEWLCKPQTLSLATITSSLWSGWTKSAILALVTFQRPGQVTAVCARGFSFQRAEPTDVVVSPPHGSSSPR